MLREKLRTRLKEAMLAKDEISVATVRMIMASLKDCDIAARSKGNADGISDDEILSRMQSMIKQRRESAAMYERGGRDELAAREMAEITVIESGGNRRGHSGHFKGAGCRQSERYGACDGADA